MNIIQWFDLAPAELKSKLTAAGMWPAVGDEWKFLEEIFSAKLEESHSAASANRGGLLAGDWLPSIFNDPDFRACIEACDEILTVKNSDYTYGASKGADRRGQLLNFYQDAAEFNTTPFMSIGILWGKHVRAVKTFLGSGRVESEPIEGRIHDCINYLLLLFKMVCLERGS